MSVGNGIIRREKILKGRTYKVWMIDLLENINSLNRLRQRGRCHF